MKITSIRIRTLTNTGNKMVGLVTITLDNMIAIHDIKILNNQGVLFLAMPSRSTKTGTFKDIVHPINAVVRESIERVLLDAYKKCSESNIGKAQFDLISGYEGSLTGQTFDDFVAVVIN